MNGKVARSLRQMAAYNTMGEKPLVTRIAYKKLKSLHKNAKH